MPYLRFRSGLLALGALALGGCATHAASASDAQPAVFQGPHPPANLSRPCKPADLPRVLPSAGAVVDSAALVARLASLGEGTTVYSLLFAPDGEVVRAARIEGGAGTERAASTDAAVAEAVRRQGAARERWGVQLRVTSGARPSLEVARQEFCPVVVTMVRNPGTPGASSQDEINRAAWTAGAAQLPVGDGPLLPSTGPTETAAEYVATPIRKARVTVTAEGEVEDATGDAAKLRRLSLYRLEPALIDRIPVDATIEW